MLRFFINNPVFSSVVSIIIVLCGLAAIFSLPLEEYPDIAPPTITLSAHYPGASAQVLERTVASPIEDQINGATRMIYMHSTMSSNGDYNLVVTFVTGTNLNYVIGDVLNRLNTALPILPAIVQQMGVTMRKSSQNLLLSISMTSDGRYNNVYLSNYTYRNILTELSRIKGVGDIQLIGARTYSMRVWLQPDKMQKLNVSVHDVESAISDQNIEVAAGKTAFPPTDGNGMLSFNLNGQGYYSDPKQFEQIVIRQESVQYIRIKDIARVELGAFSYDTVGKLNLDNNVGLQIYLEPGANQLAVNSAVKKALIKLSGQFPSGIGYKISFDNTKFVEKSLHNVIDTLRDASILVILVIFLFLQKGRATLIPVLTIPVAIIGTFAGMWATGFSINNLTLFGIVLSIGIVVDDSIVVIESVERVMHETNLNAKASSIQAMQEVAAALIAIVLVLCCAFIPSAFLGGLTGILYRQFAITVSIAVIISGIVALTLTPALCAILLKNKKSFEVKNKFFIKFNSGFGWLTDKYIDIVKHIIEYRKTYLGVFFGIIFSTCLIYYIVPVGFIPNEDKGYFTTQISLPNNATLDRTVEVTDKYVKFLTQNKNIANNISLIGIDQLNSGAEQTNIATIISNLEDWDLRTSDSEKLINWANNEYGVKQKDATFIAYNQPAIDGLSATNGIEVYIQDKVEGNYNKLESNLTLMVQKLKASDKVKNAYFTFNSKGTEVDILADVDRAKLYNINIADIYNVLEANFGPDLVNYFYKMGSLYWVVLQGDENYRKTPFQLENLYVKNYLGVMVPISSLTNTKFTNAPDVIERFNDYLAAKIVVEPKRGFTEWDIMHLITDTAKSVLPRAYDYSWYGISYLQQNSGLSSYLAFLFGAVMIFLVLAAQFEMWRLPLVVIMGIPFALFGAGVILLARGLTNDLYFQISLITLLGLSAKNSILITEFAIAHCRSGMDKIDAVILASRQRFRPIIMTSLAFILGALPLAFASGANSNAEHSVGTGIIGGMIGSTFIATLFIPMFFVVVMGKKNVATNDSDE